MHCESADGCLINAINCQQCGKRLWLSQHLCYSSYMSLSNYRYTPAGTTRCSCWFWSDPILRCLFFFSEISSVWLFVSIFTCDLRVSRSVVRCDPTLTTGVLLDNRKCYWLNSPSYKWIQPWCSFLWFSGVWWNWAASQTEGKKANVLPPVFQLLLLSFSMPTCDE